jgi:uncharacterized membrane-anchored protein
MVMEGLVLLVVLACPIVMGASMIWMMRSMRKMHADSDSKGRRETR